MARWGRQGGDQKAGVETKAMDSCVGSRRQDKGSRSLSNKVCSSCVGSRRQDKGSRGLSNNVKHCTPASEPCRRFRR